jgi:hypothetical protein
MSTLAALNKSSVSYFSSSGPGSCRYIIIPKYDLEIHENNRINKIRKNIRMRISLPYEIRQLDESVETDFQNLIRAEEEYNNAIKKYELSKKMFFDSSTGKIMNSWIYPEKSYEISEEEAIKKVYDAKIFDKLSEIGDITRTNISVKKSTNELGDSISVKISIKNKSSLLNSLLNNKALSFTDFPNKIGDFNRSYVKTGETCEIEYLWEYGKYPNYRLLDYQEIKMHEKNIFGEENIKEIKLSDNVTLCDNDILVNNELKQKYIDELKKLYC